MRRVAQVKTAARQIEPLAVRAAIVHDWFQGYHGAERLVDTMRTDVFAPAHQPDIFTFHAARELLPTDLSNAIVHESALAGLAGIRQRGFDPGRWRYLMPYMSTFFRRLPLTNYELVVSSSHAFAMHARPPETTLHVCYCNTPMRYIWLPEVERGRVGGLGGLALRGFRRRLRARDHEAAQRPDVFVANSENVRERIRRFYGRQATVVHPPVDVEAFRSDRERDRNHFLWVHRLVAYKRPEVVIEAFRDLPYRLTMIGVGPLADRLRSKLPPNVELLGWLDDRELRRRFESAGGFIHGGEEDFGITMVEALAAGAPVIALARGGAREIVRSGVDGVLLDDVDVPSLRRAVEHVARTDWDSSALALRSRAFSRDVFRERLTTLLREALDERKR